MWWNSGTVKVQQCWRTVLVEQWKSESGTLWWNSGTVMVEQWKSVCGRVFGEECGGTVEQCDGTVEQCWWNSGTVMVELCGGTVEQ